jgi:hypothetical protein
MAHFAELDKDNKVIRVVVACNQDIANNGGEQSEQAAKHFETVCPFSQNGVKWVQTSYNHNFRKQYAGKDSYYDENKNIFIRPQPYPSWSLDANDEWRAPVLYPTITTYGTNLPYFTYWNENELKWMGKDNQNNEFSWIPSSSSWVATGN